MRSLVRSLLAASCMVVAAPAFAQEPPELGVMDRARPDYDAKGLPLGALRLKPALDIGVAIDDNVDRTATAPQSDLFFTVAPSFSLKTNWAEAMLELTGGLTRYQYASLTQENRTDWNVGLNGRVDIWHDIAVNSSTSYGLYHEPRYSANDPGNAASATTFALTHADLSIDKQPDDFGFSIGGTLDRFDYRSTPLIGGGVQNNDDRDETAWTAFAKAAYQIATGFAVYIRGSYDTRNYDTSSARNAHGYHADAGTELYLSHLVKGEVFVGYVNLQYQSPLPSIRAVDYGAGLHWYATDLMTVHLTATRSFDDTTIAGASIADDQVFGIALDYEVLRNLILQLHGDYTDSRFVGTGRIDHLAEAGINVKYLLNRYLAADASYVWQDRHSNVTGQNFRDNTVSAGLHFQL